MRINAHGYVLIRVPSHPRADIGGNVLEHIIMAERALGHALPASAIVHHVNGIKDDNRNENLVICEDNAYHMLLHVRQRVLNKGGNPNIERYCSRCRTVKPFDAFILARRDKATGRTSMCKACFRDDKKAKRIAAGLIVGYGTYMRSQTHCKHGHEFTPENTFIRNRKGGGRDCRTCRKRRGTKYNHKRRSKGDLLERNV